MGAPVFARPDGVDKKQAYFVVGGTDARAVKAAKPILLATGSSVFDFGQGDAGAGSVVKLCGNFLIARYAAGKGRKRENERPSLAMQKSGQAFAAET